MTNISPVSVHGGHSGQFCHHATDTLEEIIELYIARQFAWVGITEHAPGISLELLYPDQRAAGFTPEFLLNRFAGYMKECRRLQEKYRDRIEIFAAMESETYSGYREFIPYLIKKFRPDYIVGSVHFVDDMGFDYSREQYDQTAAAVGGTDELYCRYFDQQYEMIGLLQPSVVGHFDLVRIFDPDYKTRLLQPEIMARIKRNLELIKELDLIMDFNLRSLLKGADEPYISRVILEMARKMEIAVVPGDDSHGLANIGMNMEKGIALLAEMGFATDWPKPKRIIY
ncbi:MAG TPA: histidinol phosphatase [Desulfobulbaceae bacterium]|nr:histidinol phosphatase [Desulfobulbaceae bacterium]